MNKNFAFLACAKTLDKINNQSENILGQGACSYHTMGYLLLEAYLKGNKEVKEFVDTLIKNFNDKRKSSNKNLDELFDWIDIEKYPVEALEYNKIYYNLEFSFYGYDSLNNGQAGNLGVYTQSKHVGTKLEKLFKVNEETGVGRKFNLSNDPDKNNINILKGEGKILVNEKEWRENKIRLIKTQLQALEKLKQDIEQDNGIDKNPDMQIELYKEFYEAQGLNLDVDSINQSIE